MSQDRQLSAQIQQEFQSQGFQINAIARNDGSLELSGTVAVEPSGSAFNVLVADIVKRFPAIRKVSRAGVSFVRQRQASQYALSPNDEELKEYYDDWQQLTDKIKHLANLIRNSRHFVVFTGAGISTSAKIPDFRGPNGVWTRRDRGQAAPKSVTMEAAQPTYAHRALLQLLQQGTVKYIVSQNVDGLHRRSGIPAESISEVHGNCFIELCASCGKEYLRDYDVCRYQGPYFSGVRDHLSQSGISHITGRKCDDCEGMLRDSIIHFKENLPEQALELAIRHSRAADLVLCIGSSLRVSPTCNLPERAKGPVCIINLQCTGKDEQAMQSGGLLLHGKCDSVMALLLNELGTPLPYSQDDSVAQELQQLLASAPAAAAAALPDAKQDDDKHADEPEPGAPAAPAPVLPASLFVGNTHELVPPQYGEDSESSHKWELFVSESAEKSMGDECGAYIEKVEVDLHPTFRPSRIVLTQAPFVLSRVGWGTFDIQVAIHFKPEFNVPEPLQLTHSLSFRGSGVAFQHEVPRPKPSRGMLDQIRDFAQNILNPTSTRVTTRSGRSFIENRNS
eukprot:TRINITY_DN6765_c0_g2_i6.p1 TRINITY_DN6765_c0_g2~~TRINITY_DN6765_c0_g2_i6.p1  ORF type:complete len:564 (-),score=181.36 TRINITY_DN6765_c0_g2_i6:76-1767(-)